MKQITYSDFFEAFVNIPPHEICYIHQSRPETLLIIGKSRAGFIPATLDSLERELVGHSFLRVHPKFLINLVHVEFFNKNIVRIAGVEIPIGKEYFPLLMERLNVVNAKNQ